MAKERCHDSPPNGQRPSLRTVKFETNRSVYAMHKHTIPQPSQMHQMPPEDSCLADRSTGSCISMAFGGLELELELELELAIVILPRQFLKLLQIGRAHV